MKRIHVIIVVLMVSGLTVAQAQSMSDVWRDVPQSIVPTVSHTSRLDMIDLYRVGMKAQATTLMGDTAQITYMGDTYIHVRVSRVSTLQIKRLKRRRKIIYAVVTTVEGPAANSHIELYDKEWRELPLKKYLKLPTIDDFIDKSTDLRKDVVVPTIRYVMNDSTDVIVATPSFVYTLDTEFQERIKPYITPEITIRWKSM